MERGEQVGGKVTGQLALSMRHSIRDKRNSVSGRWKVRTNNRGCPLTLTTAVQGGVQKGKAVGLLSPMVMVSPWAPSAGSRSELLPSVT